MLKIRQSSEILQYKKRFYDNFPITWSRIIAECNEDSGEDCFWLTYSANYLLRTDNVLWAVDPMLTKGLKACESYNRFYLKKLPKPNKMSFVLLTHAHSDHLDLSLIKTLKQSSIYWVIPKHMLKKVTRNTGLSMQSIIIPEYNKTFTIGNIRITPFKGLHKRKETCTDKKNGPDSTGYLVETEKQKIAFPGDVRSFGKHPINYTYPVDTVFAHIWMGRNNALVERPALFEAFCQFFLEMQPKKIILTHLYSVHREIENCWTEAHAKEALSYFKQKNQKIKTVIPYVGQRTEL